MAKRKQAERKARKQEERDRQSEPAHDSEMAGRLDDDLPF